MFRLIKGLFKTAVVTSAVAAAVAGGTILVAGSDGAAAMAERAKGELLDRVGGAPDDPAVLRSELEALSHSYPEDIARVHKGLTEVVAQIEHLRKDQRVSERVVSLAQEDLAVLEPQLEGAGEGLSSARYVAASTAGEVINVARASSTVTRLNRLVDSHAARMEDASNDLVLLEQERVEYETYLNKLRSEQAQFKIELQQLDRQVDSIERNEAMISLRERRQRTFDSLKSRKVASLDQMTDKLKRIKSMQEAQLEALESESHAVNYEELARTQLEEEVRGLDLKNEAKDEVLRLAR